MIGYSEDYKGLIPMKKMERLERIGCSVCFFALLVAAIMLTTHVLEYKESTEKFGLFLEDPSQYDVLFLGNSHMADAAYPMELWKDYGITSYNLGNGGNTMAMTYWILMSAFELGADPTAIVLDVDDVGLWGKTEKNEGTLHTAVDFLPLSRSKLALIKDLVIDEPAFKGLEWEFIFTLGKYHDRWQEVTLDELRRKKNLDKGSQVMIGVAVPREYEVYDAFQWMDDERVGYDYLKRIIDECRDRDIGLLLVRLPFPASEFEQERVSGVWNVARNYDVEYIDFLGMDSAVDYRTDCYDSNSHLNPSGARKISDYLGQVLVERYGVQDRRGDADCALWNVESDEYTDRKLEFIRREESVYSALMLLHDSEFSAIISVRRDSPLYGDEQLLRLMQNIAREHLLGDEVYYTWADSLMPLAQLNRAAEHGAPYFVLIDRGSGGWDASISERLGVGKDVIVTSFGDVTYRSGEDGAYVALGSQVIFEAQADAPDVRIAVIDTRTGEVAAELDFNVPQEDEQEINQETAI